MKTPAAHSAALVLALALILVLLSACATPGARESSSVVRHYRTEAGLSKSGLPDATKALLADRGWDRMTNEEACVLMEAAAASEPGLRLELAELHLLTGDRAGALHAARNAWLWLGSTPEGDADEQRALRLYNHAVAVCVLNGTMVLPPEFAGVLAAWDIPDRQFRRRVTRDGLGATLLGILPQSNARDAANPFLPPADVGVALTAIIRFDGAGPAFELHDPLTTETVRAFGRDCALAADWTAPLAYLVEQGMPEEVREASGCFLLEPLRRNKIPVLFLHGMNARPADFRWMVNELRADEDVRRRYQFIAYRYPSDVPLGILGVQLRRDLDRFWAWFDDAAPNARDNGYVIVGHGLGGLLAKTLAVESDDEIFRAMFRVPRGEVDLSGELGATVSSALFLKPDPKLRRILFLGVPHQGNVLPSERPSNVGVVEEPKELARLRKQMVKRWGDQLQPEVRERIVGRFSAIDNLSAKSVYIQALAALPFASWIRYDSVIGNVDGVSGKPTTDGVVTYESAHLAGADSETVIRSGHDVHRTKHGTEAVRGILTRYLAILDDAN